MNCCFGEAPSREGLLRGDVLSVPRMFVMSRPRERCRTAGTEAVAMPSAHSATPPEALEVCSRRAKEGLYIAFIKKNTWNFEKYVSEDNIMTFWTCVL